MMPLYQSVKLSIVPMVNPDGVDLVLNGPPASLKNDLLSINKGRPTLAGGRQILEVWI